MSLPAIISILSGSVYFWGVPRPLTYSVITRRTHKSYHIVELVVKVYCSESINDRMPAREKETGRGWKNLCTDFLVLFLSDEETHQMCFFPS